MSDEPIEPTPIDAWPEPTPLRTMPRAQFRAAADAWQAAFPGRTAQFNQSAEDTSQNASVAFASAASASEDAEIASAARAAAEAAANAELWVSGQTYQIGENAISPIDLQTYRANTTTSGTTDPSESADWSPLVPAAGLGLGGASFTGSVVLDADSPAMISVTTTAYGQSVTLPDATELATGVPVFSISNDGLQPLAIRNASGGLLGYAKIDSYVVCSLVNNESVEGDWKIFGASNVQVDADGVVTFGVAESATTLRLLVADIDESRKLFMFSGTSLAQAVMYNESTGAFGTPVLVQSGNINDKMYLIKSNTDQALFVNFITTTLRAVVLTIDDLSITVGTSVSSEMADSIGTVGTQQLNGQDILRVGDSFVFPYVRGSTSHLRAITIAGTTPTISAEHNLTGQQLGITFKIDESTVVAFSQSNSSSIHVKPVTISGTTLTGGTQVDISCDVNGFLVRPIGSRWAVLSKNSANLRGSIITVTGTVATSSSLFLTSAAANNRNAMFINGNRVICVGDNGSTAYVNVMTDTAGTATAGTEIAIPFTLAPTLYGYADDGMFYSLGTTNTQLNLYKLTNADGQPLVVPLQTFGTGSQRWSFHGMAQFGRGDVSLAGPLISGSRSYEMTLNLDGADSVDGFLKPRERVDSLQGGAYRQSPNSVWLIRRVLSGLTNRVFNIKRYTAV
jgi:hypothetical protein